MYFIFFPQGSETYITIPNEFLLVHNFYSYGTSPRTSNILLFVVMHLECYETGSHAIISLYKFLSRAQQRGSRKKSTLQKRNCKIHFHRYSKSSPAVFNGHRQQPHRRPQRPLPPPPDPNAPTPTPPPNNKSCLHYLFKPSVHIAIELFQI